MPPLILFPCFPDFRMVAYSDLTSIAYNGRVEQLRVFKQLLFRRVPGDIGHVEILIGPALGIDQIFEGQFCPHAAVLAGGEPFFEQVDVLILDAPFLEPALRLLGVKAFG